MVLSRLIHRPYVTTKPPTTTAFDSAFNLALGWTNITSPPKAPFDYISQKRPVANETNSRLLRDRLAPVRVRRKTQ